MPGWIGTGKKTGIQPLHVHDAWLMCCVHYSRGLGASAPSQPNCRSLAPPSFSRNTLLMMEMMMIVMMDDDDDDGEDDDVTTTMMIMMMMMMTIT